MINLRGLTNLVKKIVKKKTKNRVMYLIRNNMEINIGNKTNNFPNRRKSAMYFCFNQPSEKQFFNSFFKISIRKSGTVKVNM